MSTLHFAIALTLGVYAYVLLPDWIAPMILVSLYVVWQSLRAPSGYNKFWTQYHYGLGHTDYAVNFMWRGRKMRFSWCPIYGLSNLSERHTADRCDNDAYCPDHGSL